MAQTVSDIEIIIVEDCSTDKSKEIAAQFISEKVKIISHEKNKGLSASRNTGIKNATANYVAFLDADDVWKPQFLEKIQSLINLFPEAKLFATNYEERYPDNVIVLPKNKSADFQNDTVIEDFFDANLAQPLYHPCSLCVEKSVFEKVGFFDKNITFAEDVDFNIRANNAYKLAYSKEPLLTYNMFSENQITNTSLKNKTIPNFDYYENIASNNPSLKKYLDFHRYIFAKHYKLENDQANFEKMVKGLAPESLNFKQRLLLQLPVFFAKRY